MNQFTKGWHYFAVALTVVSIAGSYPVAASAQRVANGTMKIVVPFAAGGSADLVARLVGGKVAAALGKVGVVDNRSGAAGQLGLQEVIHAAPDGNTLLVTPNGPISISPNLQKLPYDPAQDLVPVAMIAFVPSAIAVTQSSPWRTLGDLIAAAKTDTNVVSYSVPAIGTHMHLAGELLHSMTGAKLGAVPYRGTSQAAIAIASGEVQMGISDLSTLQPMAKAGRLRILAVTGSRRTETAPELPTVAELGIKGYAADAWIGMFAPAGTPPDLIARMNVEAAKVLQMPDVRQVLFTAGLEPLPMPVPQMTSFLKDESSKWAKVIKDANIKLEN